MAGMGSSIERSIRGSDAGAASGAALRVLSALYGLGVRLRLALYAASVFKARSVPCPVVSVGNISVGGTGKTPVTLRVVEILKGLGIRPVILSRGYRRSGTGVGVVSDGVEVLMDAETAGDEPLLLARRAPGVPVVVSADRVGGALYAIDRFSAGCIVLDDGFQHVRLARDLDIVLIDADAGFGNGCLLPRGPLREPPSALRRAGLVMVRDGKEKLGRNETEAVERTGLPVLGFGYRAASLTELPGGKRRDVESLKESSVLAFAGTARPASFFSTLEGLGARLVARVEYPDHHAYCRRDMEEVVEAATGAGAAMVVTTEKDAVKLGPLLGPELSRGPAFYSLGIDAVIEREDELRRLLAGRTGAGGRG